MSARWPNMPSKQPTYNNLIDVCISLEEDPQLSGKTSDMFKALLSGYFFKYEAGESKNFAALLANMEIPDFIANAKTIFDIDRESLSSYVMGGTINESLAGKLMLSTQYLTAFYSSHPPAFSKLPEDVKFELIDRVKEKNEIIVSAFDKMNQDRDSDKKRLIVTLIALLLKNVHKKTAMPLSKLDAGADETIRKIFRNCDSVFLAAETQVSDLRDETKIKELIKKFFVIKQFKDIKEISDVYKSELERYIKRGMRASV